MNTTIRRSAVAAGASALAAALAVSLSGSASAQVPAAAPMRAAAVAPAAAATLAPAYSTMYAHVVCSAVNIRAGHSTSSTILGVGYLGDPDAVTIGYLPKGSDAFTWLYGTVTRQSDHRRVTGWAIATCVH